MHLKTGLDFAPGTTEDCKKIVGQLLTPPAILAAYRTARNECGTSDIVLVVSDQSPDISGGSRREYAQHLWRAFGPRAREFGIFNNSAHSVMSLPDEEEAMWLVVTIKGVELPLMCVIYAMAYESAAAS